MSVNVTAPLALPPGFRPDDVLALHRRDREGVAERVETDRFAKGLVWHGRPARLDVTFQDDHADLALAVDGPHHDGDAEALARLGRHMLGLDQPVDAFERAHADHPRLGAVIARNRGLRIPQTATPFEALSWAVIGQQISVAAAISVRRRVIRAADRCHSSGLYCYPDAASLLALPDDALRGAGLSATKARTLRVLAEGVEQGELPLEAWRDTPPAAEIGERLGRIKGIGPWTTGYALLRGFAWLDGSLHGDVAVRRGLQTLLDLPERPSPDDTRRWLADFAPWRALAAAHLWAIQSTSGY